MTGIKPTEFQLIANAKGWKFVPIGERWGKSERTMTRISAAAKQIDIDAVNGLPDLNSKKPAKKIKPAPGASLILTIIHRKGWKLLEVGKRWNKSERTMTRISTNGHQRDIDAAMGLPKKDQRNDVS